MRYLLIVLLIALIAVSAPLLPDYRANQRELIITKLSDTSCRLEWSRLPHEGGWQIQATSTPYLESSWSTIATTDRLTIELTGLPRERWFRVVSDPSLPRVDEVNWLDFESMPELTSYGNQDVDPDSVELVGNGDGGNALRLFGNTWKQLALTLPRRITPEFQVGLSMFRESKGEWQSVGFVDSSNHSVWFTLGGSETWWNDSIYNSWSETSMYNQWTRITLPVGQLFNQVWRRNGLLDRIVFANDNDDTITGRWRVDRITDATVDFRFAQRMYVSISLIDGRSYRCSATLNGEAISSGRVLWDGDVDARSTGSSTTLTFRTPGRKHVLCRWIDDNDVERWVWTPVDVPGAAPDKRAWTYCGVGDVMIARRFESENIITQVGGPDSLFNKIRPYLQRFDLVTANTECAYSYSGVQHPNKTYTFKGVPTYVPAIVRGGITVASLANNHTGDYGDGALKETFDVFDAAGLNFSGAGINDGMSWRPSIIYRGGQRIAVLGFCSLTGREQSQAPYLEAAPNKGGFNWARRDLITQQITSIRPFVDFIVIQFHAGYNEYTTEPDFGTQPSSIRSMEGWDDDEAVVDTAAVTLSDFMLQQGADLVVMHGPHVPQAVVRRPGNKYIAYSTGNFMFDQYLPETFPTISLEADIDRFSDIREARIRPLYVDNYLPGLATGQIGVRVLNHIASLSREKGTTLVEPLDGSLTRVVSEVGMFTRIALPADTIQLSVKAEGNLRVSTPFMFPDTGIVETIRMLATPLNDTIQYRVGIDELFAVGNMEDEGAPTTWEFETGESIDDSASATGRRSVRIRRSTGFATMTVPTRRRYVLDRNRAYTVSAKILPGGISGSNVRLDYYSGRTGANTPTPATEVIAQATTGTNWVELFGDPTIPTNTNCMIIRLRLAAGTTTTSWFDDVAMIDWGTGWTRATQVNLPNPHRWTHAQFRTTDTTATSIRLVVQRARLVANPR